MTRISSHVLDIALGRPASSLGVRLDRLDGTGTWTTLAATTTGEDGRVVDMVPGAELLAGTYRLSFDTGSYLEGARRPGFYPWVDVVFRIESPAEHHHIPLLLSPFGYSTYRGS
jgi:5-hydroxyisourate hydrolase